MKKLIAFAFLLYFITPLHSQEHRNIIWFTEKSGMSDQGFEEGQTIPNLSLKDVHKKRFNLHDNLDKLTILDFRAMSCDPCTKNNKYLLNFYEQYPIEIISIYNDDRWVEVKDYAKSNGLMWSHIQDNAPPKQKFEKQLGIDDNYPDYIVISPDKKVLKVFGSPKGVAMLGVFLQKYFSN